MYQIHTTRVLFTFLYPFACFASENKGDYFVIAPEDCYLEEIFFLTSE